MTSVLPRVRLPFYQVCRTWSLFASQQFIPCTVCRFSSRGNAHQKDTDKIMTMHEVRADLLAMIGIRDEKGTVKSESGVMQKIFSSQEQMHRRRPSDSYARVVVPLSSDSKLREKYLTINQAIRFGRLLEDFDSLAGLLCYKHNADPELPEDQKSPYAFVTAIVDRIDIDPSLRPLSPFKDIFFDGNITWVGRSSLECTMNLEQEMDGKMQAVIKARYLFVARNSCSKAAVVNPLDPETEEEKELFRQGEERKARRIQETNRSVLKMPPSSHEGRLIHDIFLSTLDLESGTLRTRVKPENAEWMGNTILKSLIICQPEQRNLYNKIFGGFLMRKAFELAWTSSALHSKSRFPICKKVDYILFRRPVEIGSLLFLSSQIVYSEGRDLQIRVHAEVVDTETGSQETTNDFHFTFDCGMPNMKQIIPQTYAESMLYVDGKRRYDES